MLLEALSGLTSSQGKVKVDLDKKTLNPWDVKKDNQKQMAIQIKMTWKTHRSLHENLTEKVVSSEINFHLRNRFPRRSSIFSQKE